jgi:hypothetical protein
MSAKPFQATRFARLCASQCQLASASKSVFNLSSKLPRTTFVVNSARRQLRRHFSVDTL